MSARQGLNATYAYLCGLYEEERVDAMLDGKPPDEADAVAQNRQGYQALAALARMPRAGSAAR